MGMIGDLFVKLGLKKDEFDKGLDDAKQKTESFGSGMANLFRQIADALGLGKIVAQIDAGTAAMVRFFASFKAVAVGSQIFAGAMRIVKAAMISTGVGALIVALGSLVAYFTQTERGAEMLERAMAKVKAVFQVIIDRASKMGEGLMYIATGRFAEGWRVLRESVKGMGEEMAREAKIAGDLEAQYQALEDKERDLIEVNAKRREEASALKLESRNMSLSIDERITALKKAIAIENAAFKDEKDIAAEKARIYKAQISQGEVRDEQLKKSAELNAAVTEIQGRANDATRANMRYLNSLTQQQHDYNLELEATNEALSKQMKAREEITKPKPSNKTTIENGQFKSPTKGIMDIKTEDLGLEEMQSKMSESEAMEAASMARRKEALVQFNQEFNSLISGGMADAAMALGEGIAKLASHDMNLADFGKSLLGVVGRFMVQFGQLVIAFAIAASGLQAAIKSGGIAWPLALAGGIALVAIGSAISSLTSKGITGTAGGGYTASGAGGGNGYNPNSVRSQSDNKVVFEIQGTKLVGVLANTAANKRITG